MSISNYFPGTGQVQAWKKINASTVTCDECITGELTTGAITSSGAISGTNITPYCQYMRIEADGSFGSSFGNMVGNPSKTGTGTYRYTFTNSPIPRVPFSIQLTIDQRTTNTTADRVFVVTATQGFIEWKTKDASGNAIDASVYVAIMG